MITFKNVFEFHSRNDNYKCNTSNLQLYSNKCINYFIYFLQELNYFLKNTAADILVPIER